MYDVSIRTPDIKQAEFDKSPQAIWSPGAQRPGSRSEAEAERGPPRAISPGAPIFQNAISHLALQLSSSLAPKPGGCGSFAGLGVAHAFRGFDQAREFRLGVVRRDATTTMSQQVLSILKRHTSRPQSPAEGMLQVVNPDAPEPAGAVCLCSCSQASAARSRAAFQAVL